MRQELHPLGVEVVDVCLEMGGADAARRWVDAAASTHPSLVDRSHALDARFGVTNVPQVIWIDESCTVVRPPEPGTPPAVGDDAERVVALVGDGEERAGYLARLRDWAEHGSASRWALTPDEVVARSQPRPREVSAAAAHFELAQHLWDGEGLSDRVVAHFNAAHELQPANITYKRQAYSILGVERSGDDDWGRFRQVPGEGEDWPFVSDFTKDLVAHDPALAARLGLG